MARGKWQAECEAGGELAFSIPYCMLANGVAALEGGSRLCPALCALPPATAHLDTRRGALPWTLAPSRDGDMERRVEIEVAVAPLVSEIPGGAVLAGMSLPSLSPIIAVRARFLGIEMG